MRRGRRHLVLWLGSISSQEGLGRLIEAADDLVLGRGRSDISFALIGRGDAHEELRGEVRRRGLEEYVEVSEAIGDDLVRAAQVAALLDDEPRRLRLGAEARRRAMNGLMWNQQVPALLRAVDTALGEPACAPAAVEPHPSSARA